MKASTPCAIDLFAGAGGASEGLRQAGIQVLAAIEANPVAAETFAANHGRTRLLACDIDDVSPDRLRISLGLDKGELTVLKACPPCQGYSSLGSRRPDDPRNELIGTVWKFVDEFEPLIVVIENVPGISSDTRLALLIRKLRRARYGVRQYDVEASDLGVPQRRRRHIVVAAKGVPKRDLPSAIALPQRRQSAGDALRVLAAGQADVDPLDVFRSLRPLTQKRVEAIPPSGGRFDLPPELQLECHKSLGSRGASSSYGRIDPAEPAPTMTTRCTTPACGRFIHPHLDRGLTLREAASFQTFPPRYDFRGNYGEIEAQIGNALPVRLGKLIGELCLQVA